MITKEYSCDEQQGTFQYRLSLPEIGKKKIIIEVDYWAVSDSTFDTKIHCGSLDAEYLLPLEEEQFDVEYTKLKSSVTTYVKSHIDDWKDSIISAVSEILRRKDYAERIGEMWLLYIEDCGEFMVREIRMNGQYRTEVYGCQDGEERKILQVDGKFKYDELRESVKRLKS